MGRSLYAEYRKAFDISVLAWVTTEIPWGWRSCSFLAFASYLTIHIDIHIHIHIHIYIHVRGSTIIDRIVTFKIR